jgi:AraC family transcriptional regulator of adaptative response/methylated-DNA-[protein]-cysteine methyltransferase
MSALALPAAAAARVTRTLALRAVRARDARFDGRFVYGVSTTGVFCRPSCRSRQAKPEHVQVFDTTAAAIAAGFRPCKRCEPVAANRNEDRVIARAREVLDLETTRRVPLDDLARACGMSASHLQRVFTRVVGLSPKQYHDAVRARALRTRLREGAGPTRAAAAAGFGGGTRVRTRAIALLGMPASTFARNGAGLEITYAVEDTPLGVALIAFTARGVCKVSLGDSAAALKVELARDFGRATLRQLGGAPQDHPWIRDVAAWLSDARARSVPLDVAGTEFQRRVWQELQRIPKGETRTYSEVAASIGRPTAARAVARACASNRVAVLVPCHRVIRGDGSPGGYRWGIERKHRLLEEERRGPEDRKTGSPDDRMTG